MRAFVIFVPKKSPDTADHDDAAHPVVPIIAHVMKTQISSRVSAFETGVIVKDELGEADNFLARLDGDFAGAARMITERAQFPFHVDDTAVVRRQFGFRYLSHKRRRFDLNLEQGLPPCRED